MRKEAEKARQMGEARGRGLTGVAESGEIMQVDPEQAWLKGEEKIRSAVGLGVCQFEFGCDMSEFKLTKHVTCPNSN